MSATLLLAIFAAGQLSVPSGSTLQPQATDSPLSTNAQLQCSSPTSTNFQFVMTSSRNQTGHWVAQVQLDHDKGMPFHDQEYEIQLEQNTKICGYEPLRTSAVISAPPPAGAPRSPGYKLFPGLGYYKLNLKQLGWEDAQRACEEEDTHLAVINSKDEAEALLELFAHNLDIHYEEKKDDQAWIGVREKQTEGNYVTVLGDPLSTAGYARWAPSQPNNYGLYDHCVTVRRNGRLSASYCGMEVAFFCEWEL